MKGILLKLDYWTIGRLYWKLNMGTNELFILYSLDESNKKKEPLKIWYYFHVIVLKLKSFFFLGGLCE